MRAYHFLRDDMRSNSGNEPPWTIGEERSISLPIVMCRNGYHWSPSWYDGLSYAPGNMACVIEYSGQTLTDTDKGVSERRRLVAVRNVATELRLWGCDCVERIFERLESQERVIDPRLKNVIVVARRFAHDEATEKELANARKAAAAADAAYVAYAAAAYAAAADAAKKTEIAWQRQHLDDILNPLFADVLS
jgi:hypothetical protein